MKKFAISIFIIAFISIIAVMAYAIKTFTIRELIICASNDDAFYIPQSFCEYYLLNYRGDEADIRELEKGAGLGFIANIDDSHKKYKLLDHFISNGMNVNTVSKIDGLTPLHSAILLNDQRLVRYLLTKGANPLKVDKKYKMTAYEYIDYLISKENKKIFDRESIRKMLSEYRDTGHLTSPNISDG